MREDDISEKDPTDAATLSSIATLPAASLADVYLVEWDDGLPVLDSTSDL
jgi:hypothetical protein